MAKVQLSPEFKATRKINRQTLSMVETQIKLVGPLEFAAIVAEAFKLDQADREAFLEIVCAKLEG